MEVHHFFSNTLPLNQILGRTKKMAFVLFIFFPDDFGRVKEPPSFRKHFRQKKVYLYCSVRLVRLPPRPTGACFFMCE